MIKAKDCLELYGEPNSNIVKNFLHIWRVPENYRKAIPCLPSKIYCHKKLPEYLMHGLDLVLLRGLENQIKTWDGCYNVRTTKGGMSWSIHSWGLAFDINANENPFRKKPKMSMELVTCFNSWFDWGGLWKVPDGMHYQIMKDLL
jgi:hypothetical protein